MTNNNQVFLLLAKANFTDTFRCLYMAESHHMLPQGNITLCESKVYTGFLRTRNDNEGQNLIKKPGRTCSAPHMDDPLSRINFL